MTDKQWVKLAPEHAAYCQNCDWQGHADDLDPIKDFWERTEEGDTVWAGDCPDCGAMCFTRAEMERQGQEWQKKDAARAMLAALEDAALDLVDHSANPHIGRIIDNTRAAIIHARAVLIGNK
tara:strand:- start:325 stop:690 length:366 start_codon:yes stop_codon:yes gene_type:complete